MPLNCIPRHGYNGKFYIIYILSQYKCILKKDKTIVGCKQMDNPSKVSLRGSTHLQGSSQYLYPTHSLQAVVLTGIPGITIITWYQGHRHERASSEVAQGPERGI